MSLRRGLLKGRSHLITAAVLIVAGSAVVQMEDRNLARETGKPIPEHRLAIPAKRLPLNSDCKRQEGPRECQSPKVASSSAGD